MKKILFLVFILLIGLAGTLVVYVKASKNEKEINVETKVIVNNSKPMFKLAIKNDFEIEIGFDNNYKLFSLKHLNDNGRKITNYYVWAKENLSTMLLRIIFKAKEEKYNVETLNLLISDNTESIEKIKDQINSAIETINANNNYNIKINYL